MLIFVYLSLMKGHGVKKDEKKELYNSEEAAIQGHTSARCNLAFHESKNGRFERAAKHLVIASNLGYDDAIQELKECYKRGLVSKADFAAALRAHQALRCNTQTTDKSHIMLIA